MAQTGSYATRKLVDCPASATGAAPASSCPRITSSRRPSRRSVSVSPTHRTGTRPVSRARCTLREVSSLVSPNTWRRSECPTSTWVAPASAAMAAEISPVNAPLSSQWMFCTPRLTPTRPRRHSWATLRDAAGGKTRIETASGPARGSKRSKNARVSEGPMCIFQLPAITGLMCSLRIRTTPRRQAALPRRGIQDSRHRPWTRG